MKNYLPQIDEVDERESTKYCNKLEYESLDNDNDDDDLSSIDHTKKKAHNIIQHIFNLVRVNLNQK